MTQNNKEAILEAIEKIQRNKDNAIQAKIQEVFINEVQPLIDKSTQQFNEAWTQKKTQLEEASTKLVQDGRERAIRLAEAEYNDILKKLKTMIGEE